MTRANLIAATQVQSRKRPFRARKRVLSARANGKRDQAVEIGFAEVEPGFCENFLRTPAQKKKGGAPRGNSNRFVHGNYSRERLELYAQIRAHIREGREMIALCPDPENHNRSVPSSFQIPYSQVQHDL